MILCSAFLGDFGRVRSVEAGDVAANSTTAHWKP
jgi:hypothetical protein